MASTDTDIETSGGKKGYTAPKGRPTVHNTGDVQVSRISPTMEWILAGIVFVAVLAAIFYFGRGFNSPAGGGHSGAPAPAPVVQLVADA